MHRQTWLIQGIDCPSCIKKIETVLSKLVGSENVRFIFATKKLEITFQPNSAVKAKEIEQAITNLGFSYVSCDKQAATGLNLGENKFKPYLNIVILAILIAFGFIINIVNPPMAKYLFILTTLIGLYPISKKAYQQICAKFYFAIETLMTIAALGALYLGESAEASMVLFLFLLGERLEGYAADSARLGVTQLVELLPKTAFKIIAGQRVSIAVNLIETGDILEISPGMRAPADGVLIDRQASFDESALTGESMPVIKVKGNLILAGTISIDKVVQMQVTSAQGDNAIDKIIHLMERAEENKAPLERIINTFSKYYTPLVVIIAIAVIFINPIFFGANWDIWIYRGLTVLLIGCPCALVISTPAAITSALAVAAKHGTLIKGGAALEKFAKVKTIALDKTGTLTEGKPDISDILTWQVNRKQLLTYAASIENGSMHPLALAIVAQAKAENLKLIKVSERSNLVGCGVRGIIDKNIIFVGAIERLKLAPTLHEKQQQEIEALEQQGKTVVVVMQNMQILGAIALQDKIRVDSQSAVYKLQESGLNIVMLTGDNKKVAKNLAGKLKIKYFANLRPENKVALIESLTKEQLTMMVGDGINDAPAMRAATIGVAMGSGMDVALESADIALTKNSLEQLVKTRNLSVAVICKIKQNIIVALGLKSIFMVTSILGITGLWVAILADTGATALVTLNSLLLLRHKK